MRLRFDEPVRIDEEERSEPSPLDPVRIYDGDGERVDKGDTRFDPDASSVLLTGLGTLAG